MTIKPLFFIVVIIAKQSFASSDINVCLERHTPIRMYNYASGQCLSSSNTEAGLKLQMHGCVVGDEKLAFFAHRASGLYNASNSYQLVNKISGQCLTAGPLGTLSVKNTPVLQFDCDGSSKQQVWKNYDTWKKFLGSTYYQISNLDENLCLTADESDPSIPHRGFPYMYPCNYYYNDQWWLPALGNC
ncbi:uncharacterized protein LOC110847542 [Folsomia candida]|uniref:uncharacterized protein LOC110847542 n=1 Tax=Folsomia candida TaxID=158441 RepID=UPI000B8F1597|nr:uncharacterized protein LOC110847542 [Folsomia candida]